MKFLVRLIQKPKLQLRWKLLSSFLIATTLLTIIQILPVLNLGQTSNTLDNLNTSIRREVLVDQINLSQEQFLNTALEAIFTGKAARVVEFDIAISNLNKAIINFSPQPWQQESYNSLNTELQWLISQLRPVVSASSAATTSIQQSIESWNQLNSKHLDHIHTLLNDLVQKERYNSTIAYQQSITQANNTILWVLLLSGLGVMIALILAFLMTSAIVQPIQQLRHCLSALAKGDLTNRINIVNQDELGELGETYNQTLASLCGLVEGLYWQSQQVNSATSELNYQANSQVAGSEQQAQAIHETTQTMGELNRTTVAIMQQAASVNTSVSNCVQEAEQVSQMVAEMATAQSRGRQTVARTISGLYMLKEQISLINNQQQILVDQSKVIEQVINTLDSITQSTHLLALNAAIEAAGAGEYGDRFRVIAREVRELSNRSTQSTSEIRVALSSIASSVEEASTLGKQCLQEAEHTVNDSSEADLVLVELANVGEQVKIAANSILEKVMQSATLAQNIGLSIHHQHATSNETVEKMLSINVITSQNLNSIKQGEVAILELSRTAQALSQSANSFKLSVVAL